MRRPNDPAAEHPCGVVDEFRRAARGNPGALALALLLHPLPAQGFDGCPAIADGGSQSCTVPSGADEAVDIGGTTASQSTYDVTNGVDVPSTTVEVLTVLIKGTIDGDVQLDNAHGDNAGVVRNLSDGTLTFAAVCAAGVVDAGRLEIGADGPDDTTTVTGDLERTGTA